MSLTFLQLASQQAKGDPSTKLAHQRPLSTGDLWEHTFRSIDDPRLGFTTKAIYIKPLHHHLSRYGDYKNYVHLALNIIYIQPHEYIHDKCTVYNSGNTASFHNSIPTPSCSHLDMLHLQYEVKPHESYRLSKGAMHK